MYKKCLEEVVARLICEKFDVTDYLRILKNEKDNTIKFTVKTVANDDDHSGYEYKGYVGSVGEIVVTTINGEFLEEFIRLL